MQVIKKEVIPVIWLEVQFYDVCSDSRQWLKSEDIQRISLLFYNKILEKEVSDFFPSKSIILSIWNVSLGKFFHEIILVFFYLWHFKLHLASISEAPLAFPVVPLCTHRVTVVLATEHAFGWSPFSTLLVITGAQGMSETEGKEKEQDLNEFFLINYSDCTGVILNFKQKFEIYIEHMFGRMRNPRLNFCSI